MKNIIIRGVYAVGMHNWGTRNLEIGQVFYLKFEPENPYDTNAVAICSDKEMLRKVAYLKRSDAKFVAGLFKENIPNGPIYLKVKDAPTKFKRQCGPMQRCNLGFKMDNEHIENIKMICKNQPVELMIN